MDANYISEEEEDDEEEEEEEDEDGTSEDSSSESESESESQPPPLSQEPTREFCYQGTKLQLPEGLFQDHNIFNEFFSLDMWNNHLTSHQRTQLMQHLPIFPGNDNAEKVTTLSKIFTGANFNFGNPLHKFFGQLQKGKFDGQVEGLKMLRRRVERHERGLLEQRRICVSLKSLLATRKQQPHLARLMGQSEIVSRISRLTPVTKPTDAEERTKCRYFQELNRIRGFVGESGHSDDEIFPDGPIAGLSKKHKKQLANAELSLKQEMPVIQSSLSDLKSAQAGRNPLDFNEKYYKKVISNYRKRKLKESGQPEPNGVARRNSQQSNRAAAKPTAAKRRKLKSEPSPAHFPPVKVANGTPEHCFEEPAARVKLEPGSSKQPAASAKTAKEPTRRRSTTKATSSDLPSPIPATAVVKKETPPPMLEPEAPKPQAAVTPVVPLLVPDVAPPPPPPPVHEDPVHAALDSNQILPNITFTQQEMEALELLNMSEFEEIVAQITAAPPSTTPPVNSILPAKPEHELNQGMHVCFFTLLRDIICSTQDQRMGLAVLTAKLQAWQESPISPLNDWFGLSQNWVDHLSSAINFLSGFFPSETQPEDFVPYLEYKPHMQAFQWIGAGRDSDHNLATLCSHWLDRRNEVASSVVRDKETPDDPSLAQLPPPRCPTAWRVQTAIGVNAQMFHIQEKERYDNPNKPYTYLLHGYESVVGPIKGAYVSGAALSKPRGHTLLVTERPNYVTILSLVRDAVARLPNGEGTRSDICLLLRDSQFISQGAEENYLQSVVGGALDRLHYEPDACVKYDPKRKIWVYLHRNRSEEDFEKLHQQQGPTSKAKKPTPRKNSRTPRTPKAKEPEQITGGITIAHSADSETTAAEMDKIIAEVVNTFSNEAQLATPPLQAKPKAPPQPKSKTPQRQFAATSTLQNVQIATSTGLQTIQIAAPPKGSGAGGTSLLASSKAKQVAKKTTPAAASAPQTLLAKRAVMSSPVSVVGTRPSSSASATVTAANVILKSPVVSHTSTTVVNQPVTTVSTSMPQKSTDNTRKKVEVPQMQQVKLISAAGLEGHNVVQKSSQQPQFLAAKTVPQGIKVFPNTAMKNTTLVGGQRSQAVFIKQTGQGGQMPTLIMNKSGTLQMAAPKGTVGDKTMLTKLVAANAQGQLISLDSLSPAQQKQIMAASAAGGGTVRMATATASPKMAQQIVQVDRISGMPQLAVVAPGNIVRPRMAQPQQVGQQVKTSGLRLINQGASGFNIASIGGQQVILAGKPQTQGQNLILASGSGSNQTVVLASPTSLRPQGNALVLQQGGSQQLVLPANFQGLKTLQNVQGIRVIPIAQASQANTSLPKGRQQVYARIISPSSRATTTPVTATLNKSVEGTKSVDSSAE